MIEYEIIFPYGEIIKHKANKVIINTCGAVTFEDGVGDPTLIISTGNWTSVREVNV